MSIKVNANGEICACPSGTIKLCAECGCLRYTYTVQYSFANCRLGSLCSGTGTVTVTRSGSTCNYFGRSNQVRVSYYPDTGIFETEIRSSTGEICWRSRWQPGTFDCNGTNVSTTNLAQSTCTGSVMVS